MKMKMRNPYLLFDFGMKIAGSGSYRSVLNVIIFTFSQGYLKLFN